MVTRFQGKVVFAPNGTNLPAGGTIGGGSSPAGVAVLTATGTLSSAQILSNQPIPVVPAPGPGKFILVVASIYRLHFGTVAHTTTTGSGGCYFGTTTNQADNGDGVVFNNPSDTYTVQNGYNNNNRDPATMVNLPIVYARGNYAGGDGTGSIVLYYIIVPVV